MRSRRSIPVIGPDKLYFVSRSDGRRYPVTDRRYAGDDGGLLDLEFEARFPRDRIVRRAQGMWRYREAIPVAADDSIVSLGEPLTPLVPLSLGAATVLVKQEQLFPSGSYKDRGASVLISHARAIGVDRVVEDSSGNAGSAIAAYCARGGIDCEIYVPHDTSAGKLAQIQAYGARLRKVPGTREDTARAVLTAARTIWYASHCYNPFFFHGTKTFAFEVWEQLGWRAPDALVLPVGNGTLLLGVAIGFDELLRARLIDRLPRLYAVQAEHCAPLAAAYREGRTALTGAPPIASRPTVAEGIAIAEPVRGDQILEAVTASNGAVLTVSEPEIARAHRDMHRGGFCIEPTSAATIAGVAEVGGLLARDAVVVTLFSGHGLKAPEKLPAASGGEH